MDRQRRSFADAPLIPSTLPTAAGASVKQEAHATAENCAVCHGENGVDGIKDQLAGGQGTLASDKPVKTIGSFWPYATTLFDYIHRAMPYQAPGSLSFGDTYADGTLDGMGRVVDEGALLPLGCRAQRTLRKFDAHLLRDFGVDPGMIGKPPDEATKLWRKFV